MSCSIFIPHGGGPLPLLNDAAHLELNPFLKNVLNVVARPRAILVVSAHWEEEVFTLTSNASPKLIYDYYGFPAECYRYEYSAKGESSLASQLHQLLLQNGIPSKLDPDRGFDHGMFVPLLLMNPKGDIPCIQISLKKGLNSEEHIQLGQVIAKLKDQDILLLGSGFSFHNLPVFFSTKAEEEDRKNNSFQEWLYSVCVDKELSEFERENYLRDWQQAPFASYCHPREEHLLPLHVCYGFKKAAAERIFYGKVINKNVSGFLWQ